MVLLHVIRAKDSLRCEAKVFVHMDTGNANILFANCMGVKYR